VSRSNGDVADLYQTRCQTKNNEDQREVLVAAKRCESTPTMSDMRQFDFCGAGALQLTLFSDAEGTEDQVQDVVGGSGAGDVVERTQRGVEIE
jgi:hypothetical protein